MEDADFSGYATKAGLKCSDGRTIMADAFAHQDKMKVPLVWQHGHGEPTNVLGHAFLENRDATHPDGAGVYTYAFFNSTEPGKQAKSLVQHGDIVALSIYANKLVERSKQVLHGAIKEVSLVLSGANPGALIDNIAVAHSDGEVEKLDDEAVIYTGLTIEHAEEKSSDSSDAKEETVQEVYDTLTDKQKEVVHFMIGAAVETNGVEHSDEDSEETTEETDVATTDDEVVDATVDETPDTTDDDSQVVTEGNESDTSVVADTADTTTEGDLNHQEGSTEMTNVFEQNGAKPDGPTLTHDQLSTIVSTAKQPGGTFKGALLAHAAEYGITDINLLFPDAQALTNSPEWVARRMEWVTAVLGGTKHSPFAKVKTIVADITEPEARAKGYMKGNLKKDEVFKLLRRTTGPATIYKKQKLDRDDLLDITDLDVVSWLKAEMRLMLEEEIARAILVGDGRSALSEDKVKDPEGAIDGTGIRSILLDDDLYSIKTNLAPNVSPKDAVKGLVRARSAYRGTGKPTLFVSDAFLTDIMLEEDKFGRPLYATEAVLADKLRVKEIVTVDLFDEHEDLFAIMVSLVDYTIGSNKGGELTSFEDFDIDYNQHKYLQETRLSGGLTKPFSAIVVTRAMGTLAVATAPSFDGVTNTITIPVVTGVIYTINDVAVTGTVVITQVTEVEAITDDTHYLGANTTRSWTFTP